MDVDTACAVGVQVNTEASDAQLEEPTGVEPYEKWLQQERATAPAGSEIYSIERGFFFLPPRCFRRARAENLEKRKGRNGKA